jgi:hypothetical protein
MTKTIYVRLLGEGVTVYRPVLAKEIAPSVYVIDGTTLYSSDDEEWEFKPGSQVVVEERLLEGKRELVATAAVR